MHECEYILGESFVIRGMKDATSSSVDGKKRYPVSSEEGVAARTEDGVDVSSGSMPVALILFLVALTPKRSGSRCRSSPEGRLGDEHARKKVK